MCFYERAHVVVAGGRKVGLVLQATRVGRLASTRVRCLVVHCKLTAFNVG